MHDRETLAVAARDGDRTAMERFVEQIQPDVWRYCVHLASRNEAEDLTQEALFRVVKFLHRWQRGAAISWVLGVTRNVCLEDIRRRTRRRTDPTATPAVQPVGDQTGASDLRQLLESLPADQREAIVLTQLIGLPYADAAAVVGCPIGTIGSRVARARTSLALALAAPADSIADAACP